MERARIFLIEDEPSSFSTTEASLTRAGNFIVESATSFKEAMQKIPGLKDKEVQIAIVDNTVTTASDGERIAEEIKRQYQK